MKILRRLWHSLICGCHKEEHKQLWAGWARLLFPLLTMLSAGWFLVRVIPKPIRATYPCQQAAFPLLSAFVIWLLGLKSALVAWLVARCRFKKLRRAFFVTGGLLVLGLVAWAAEKAATQSSPQPRALTYGSPSGDPPNSPMGVAKGIYPGRVTWMRDTNATPWDGRTGYWWQDNTGINQAAVDRMISMNLRALTGAASDTEAWDKIFKYYNSNHDRGDIGYATNELIAIKINLNNYRPGDSCTNNGVEASKQVVLALLRQLINNASVPQTNIAVYDAVREIPGWLSQPCLAEFPRVQWFDADGKTGQRTTWVTNSSSYSVPNACGGPLVVADCASRATYIINVPLLKGHGWAGVTLSAKNHYGSIPSRDHGIYLAASQTNQPLYSMLVDLMGTRLLGDKTILYVDDAIYGVSATSTAVSRNWAAFTNLFNGQWSASIFMSFDPVAIDSVCCDFLWSEFGLTLGYWDDAYYQPGRNCDRYLHEAALADNPPSGTVYRPDGVRLHSLGVHEHWNNPIDKQYSRNLSTNGTGIELVAVHDLATQLELVSPTNGAVFFPGTNILLQVAPGPRTTLTRVDYFANGLLLGTSTNAPFDLAWTNAAAGDWALSALGVDSYGGGCTSGIVNVKVAGVSVAVVSPGDGAVLQEGTNVTIQADAASDLGSVTQVDFYVNGALLGSAFSPPYSVVWTSVPAGSWRLNAVATDSVGLVGTSRVVNVTVLRDIQVAVTAPSEGEIFPEGINLTLCATAACPLTAISRVDFYDNGALVGRADSSPYSVVRTNALPGLRSLTAVATETEGFSATSAVVKVAVVPKQPLAAGTLYVDLSANSIPPQCAVWENHGMLGNFTTYGPPLRMETNAAGTPFPGVRFTGSECFIGPSTVPDIEGSSDRSIEVWALEPAPLGSTEILVSSGYLGYDGGFAACYGADLTNGAFMQAWSSGPCNTGWATSEDVPVPDVWHHLVYVYDGTNQLNIYVDGLLKVARTLPAPLSTLQGTELVVGVGDIGAGWYAWGWFNGYLNSVRVHGGALSPGDVWVNYLAGPARWQPAPVTILTQPSDLVVPEYSNAALSVVPNGVGPFSYQWYRSGVPLPGATNSTCALTNLLWSDSGAQLFCVVSPPYDCPSCTTTSRTATITIQPELPAVIFYAAVESKKLFGLIFTTVPGNQYQVEYKDDLDAPLWMPLCPAETATVAALTVIDYSNFLTNQHRFYRVVRLPEPPVTLGTEPGDLVIPEAGDGILSVAPEGIGPFSYQWYRAGVPLPGVTDATFAMTNLMWSGSDSQLYCVVSALYDCPSCVVTSRTATITVQPTLPTVFFCAAVAEKELFGLMFTAIPGGHYQVEYTEALDAPAWSPLCPGETASDTYLTVLDYSNFLTNRQRFYRVVRVP